MKILVIGENSQFMECKSRFGSFELFHATSHHDARPMFSRADVVFDFIIDEDPSQAQYYSSCEAPVFLNSVKSSLSELIPGDMTGARFLGFNGLPTFVNRPVLEVAVKNEGDREIVSLVCSQLNIPFEFAADQPGMVSARVVSMIINEAFATVEDGTATAEDIDLAMKLGTNYPRGPVEWGRQIGLKNVCDVLDALYRRTGNERYVVCSLLREESRRE